MPQKKEDCRGKVDYIKTIYELDSEDGKGVKSINIVRRLNLKKGSVSEMLKKLAKEGLVKAEKYSNVFLTEQGTKFAESLFDNHKVIKEFLIKYLGFGDFEAYDEAHKLEHAFSKESVGRIKQIVSGSRIINLPNYVG